MANGLASGATLTAGQQLTIPNKITNIHNDYQTFKPYNPGEIIATPRRTCRIRRRRRRRTRGVALSYDHHGDRRIVVTVFHGRAAYRRSWAGIRRDGWGCGR